MFNRKFNKKEVDIILSSIIIVIDSREQKNKNITDVFDKACIPYIIEKLDHADYSFVIPSNKELGIEEDMYFSNEISIEKKNGLNELAGNIGGARERFRRQFERHQGKMILMIEEDSYADILEHRYRSKMNPKSFIGTLHSWSTQYNVPFIFIDRKCSGQYIYFTFYYWLRNLIK